MSIALRGPLVIVTDDDLVRVSHENPGYRFEREADGTIIVTPTATESGARSGEALWQLREYRKRAGGSVFDASTGFAIGPRGRVFSPSAAWIRQDRIEALAAAGCDDGFWPISPDVVIEVRSVSESFDQTLYKTRCFVGRGTRYALAIDPVTRDVVERGTKLAGLDIDVDAIIDA